VRLFTGIAIGEEVLNSLEQAMRELRPLAPLNWSPVENLHITSKFIGEWPEQRLGELTQVLEEIHAPAAFAVAFPVTVARFGYLPNPHNPRMLFAGVQAGPVLGELARQIEDALVPLGVAREDRPYTPHITLARIGNKPIRAVREHIASMKNPDFGTFQVSEFHLYLSRSRPGGSGSIYKALTTLPLGPRA
jgi:RNA 2',3'-cyclic 3'-phosphodiesterase